MVRAFILGAGATRADYPNAPLDADFFQKLRSFRGDLEGALEEELSELRPDYREGGLEKILMEIETFSDSRQRYLRENIYKGMYSLIAQNTDSDSGFDNTFNNQKKTTSHKILVSKCSDSDFFITLNYDLSLDMAVWEDRASYTARHSYIDYGFLGIQNVGKLLVTEERRKSVYHLHGSLNWSIREDNEIVVHPKAMPPLQSSSQLNPFIVPPGPKEYPPLIEHIWDTAKQRLKKADELIVVGCSLNPADEKLLELIKEWRTKHPKAKTRVIHLDPSLEERYRGTLGRETVFFDKGFGLDAIDFIFDNQNEG